MEEREICIVTAKSISLHPKHPKLVLTTGKELKHNCSQQLLSANSQAQISQPMRETHRTGENK